MKNNSANELINLVMFQHLAKSTFLSVYKKIVNKVSNKKFKYVRNKY